jgi:hypothetical protein
MTDKNQPKEPSAIIVPFGKHKGKTVAELLATDAQYAEWITGQGWVAERFAELHAAILSRGALSDDTPEHNALQARFLDVDFRSATLRLAVPGRIKERAAYTMEWLKENIMEAKKSAEETKVAYQSYNQYQPEAALKIAAAEIAIRDADRRFGFAKASVPSLCTEARFEVRGVDVLVTWWFRVEDSDFRGDQQTSVELKPAIGDDYPTIMRQMNRLGASVLVVGQYTGRGVSEQQMRQMFSASNITVLFVQEIEEAMR